ncbi:MAG: reverse transcriptase domain-containing protein [Patescibacteria group bacterium]|nr:reverse transcriptase domain-containing protein [Patescibacteria group bacterium]
MIGRVFKAGGGQLKEEFFIKIKLDIKFSQITDLENLLEAWREFLKGKKKKPDVALFQRNLIDNIFSLRDDLISRTYRHGAYQAFNISDPKPRNIHKATVRDRVLHRAIYRQLYSFFDRIFIASSFSCRLGKGTHRGLKYFQSNGYKVSKNNTRTAWILKCDIKKFFASVDHKALLKILAQYITDQDVLWLLKETVGSFENKPKIGLPLGNLTSQLFANVYLNEFDQFVKHNLKVKYYLRYADDFVLLSEDKNWLEGQIPHLKTFLSERLRLTMHPRKIFLKTLASGVDFLGWVNFFHHRVVRTSTKKKLTKRIKANPTKETIASYLGLLSHGNTYKLKKKIRLADKFKKDGA